MGDDVDMSLLNSFRNYNNLNKDVYKLYIQKEDKCDDLKAKLKQELGKDYKDIDDFCTRLGGILYKLNNLNIVPLVDNDDCPVVNYWAYDYLFKKKFFNNHTVMDILKFVNVLSTFWKEFVGEKICSLDRSLTNEDYFKLEKTFYDYILDYSTIKHNIDNNKFVCTENLKDYLKKGFQSYETVKDKCSVDSKLAYCNLLQESTKKNDTGISSEMKCNAHSSRGLDLRGERDIQDPFGQHAPGEGDHGFHDLPRTDQDESSISPSSIPIAVTLPTVGALLTSFIFLKFTPLRSWLHGHLAENKMLMFNENGEETNTLLDDEYEEYHTYSPMDEHHIHYHAA
ncbi:PIR Superfamily Protein [Plasmodium ovale wallikeri]|uniref:PIR Superfamily Protein n=1 Tax=Plasmodium ovale wallikeri TaxID=864142 RepID=A0A1A9ATB2_PLAOA|nr:PIR Superfamily Protein [Plasmodium ovale wallikeri]